MYRTKEQMKNEYSDTESALIAVRLHTSRILQMPNLHVAIDVLLWMFQALRKIAASLHKYIIRQGSLCVRRFRHTPLYGKLDHTNIYVTVGNSHIPNRSRRDGWRERKSLCWLDTQERKHFNIICSYINLYCRVLLSAVDMVLMSDTSAWE